MNLIYVKGAVPGVDDAMVRVQDAVRKGWFNEVFPKNTNIPFPTFLGDVSTLPRELTPSLPETKIDPFSRQTRERDV